MTTSLPVIVYAKELNVSKEMMLRALVVSNLITIHMKTGIGRLSAYCTGDEPFLYSRRMGEPDSEKGMV